eukprot:GEZU01029679.1.p1 GENE.GEZU01029679.1~~GEZU01029679.1.p1  ORF type:complete len:252 (+),score=71.99 GEZU01029679.1:2-757(+)
MARGYEGDKVLDNSRQTGKINSCILRLAFQYALISLRERKARKIRERSTSNEKEMSQGDNSRRGEDDNNNNNTNGDHNTQQQDPSDSTNNNSPNPTTPLLLTVVVHSTIGNTEENAPRRRRIVRDASGELVEIEDLPTLFVPTPTMFPTDADDDDDDEEVPNSDTEEEDDDDDEDMYHYQLEPESEPEEEEEAGMAAIIATPSSDENMRDPSFLVVVNVDDSDGQQEETTINPSKSHLMLPPCLNTHNNLL